MDDNICAWEIGFIPSIIPVKKFNDLTLINPDIFYQYYLFSNKIYCFNETKGCFLEAKTKIPHCVEISKEEKNSKSQLNNITEIIVKSFLLKKILNIPKRHCLHFIQNAILKNCKIYYQGLEPNFVSEMINFLGGIVINDLNDMFELPEINIDQCYQNINILIDDLNKLREDNINELGKVPIMMYHGIINKKDSETDYIGGNVDKDGYNRTVESFRRDLEFYYSNGYRMIRLDDYVNGNINVKYGYSPIVITFDDGNPNNMKVLGKDDNGELIIDENSAVGILESFKKKYPDYNVTATFFVNDYLFQQSKYNEEILRWLVKNGYTIGNHTKGHANFSKIDANKAQEVVATVYQELDSILGTEYLHIVALPFGSPYSKTHANYPYILKGNYNGYEYETEAALRVGWEPELSPYHNDFDKTFLKRCRAYDNNGKEFDIEMVFKMLDKKRYISDGNVDTIVVSSDNKDLVNNLFDKELIVY